MQEPTIDEITQAKIGEMHNKIQATQDEIKFLLSKKINGYLKTAFIKTYTYKELNTMKG